MRVAGTNTAVAMDVNVRRVVSRVTSCRDDGVSAAAEALLDRRDPATWHQAVMDLGREICRPVPRCEECPLKRACLFRAAGRRPAPDRRSRPGFEGSFRQVRGAVVAALREEDTADASATADWMQRYAGEG